MTLIKRAFGDLKIRAGSLELSNIILNIHFWIIIAIIGALTFIYYIWFDWFLWFWQFSIFEFRNNIIGSLFFIPFAYASLVFWWRGALIVWLLSAVVILPRMIVYSITATSFVTNIILALIPLILVMIIAFEQRRRETQRSILAEWEKDRRIYMSEVFKAQEDERRRIAQELHDGNMQELIVIANHAQSLMSEADSNTPIEIIRHAEWIRDAILQVLDDIRRLSLDLRPSVLDDIGLIPALRWLINRLNQEGGVKTRMVVHSVKRKLSPETEVTIFRIVQEALNNVRRHSKATKAVVTLEFAPESIEITVQDNGEGLSLNKAIGKLAADGKLGLLGMQQRAKFLNGTFNIYSQPGKGTVVSIKVGC